MDRFMGTWYECYRHVKFPWTKGEASSIRFYNKKNDQYIYKYMSSQEYKGDKLNPKRTGVEAWGVLTNPDKKEGSYGLKFSMWQPSYAKHDIIDTDYETFAYIYNKDEMPFSGNTEYVFVYTRKPYSIESEEFQNICVKGKQYLEDIIPSSKGQLRSTK